MLKQLEEHYKMAHRKHLQKDMSYDEWRKKGEPFLWEEVEKDGIFIVLKDKSYGKLAVFSKGILLGCGNSSEILTPLNFVVLDKEYFQVHKYIWR